MIETIKAQGAPEAIGPYSHAAKTGNMIFTSGQISLDPQSGKLVEGGIENQTRQVFKNLSAVLAAAEMDFSNVVKAVVYLTDLADFSEVNKIYAEQFKENPPARSCVQVAALPAGAQVEIELIACK